MQLVFPQQDWEFENGQLTTNSAQKDPNALTLRNMHYSSMFPNWTDACMYVMCISRTKLGTANFQKSTTLLLLWGCYGHEE